VLGAVIGRGFRHRRRMLVWRLEILRHLRLEIVIAVVAMARRNGNSKREFSATGAWMRNQMLKWLLPLGAKGMDFMYAYDARAV
ncbi:hypothetical protein MOV75_32855, partial [Bradyrhizobium sp. PRIMUS42]|nr:hypothetical protein [Bradyrhizobium sp. PRIMUS42]